MPSTARGRSSIAITTGAAAAISDSSVSFGDQMVPYPTTVPKVFTLRNVGTAPLRLTSITTSGPHAADFGVVLPGLPLDLAPAASVEIATTFTPSALGARQAALRVASDDPGKGDFFVALTGKGIAAGPDIALYAGAGTSGPELFDDAGVQTFSETTVDGEATVKTFTIANKGYLDLTGIKLSKAGPDAGDFVIGAPATTTVAWAGHSCYWWRA